MQTFEMQISKIICISKQMITDYSYYSYYLAAAAHVLMLTNCRQHIYHTGIRKMTETEILLIGDSELLTTEYLCN